MSIAEIGRATENSAQGRVRASPAGKLTLHSFNPDHILAPAIRDGVTVAGDAAAFRSRLRRGARTQSAHAAR